MNKSTNNIDKQETDNNPQSSDEYFFASVESENMPGAPTWREFFFFKYEDGKINDAIISRPGHFMHDTLEVDFIGGREMTSAYVKAINKNKKGIFVRNRTESALHHLRFWRGVLHRDKSDSGATVGIGLGEFRHIHGKNGEKITISPITEKQWQTCKNAEDRIIKELEDYCNGDIAKKKAEKKEYIEGHPDLLEVKEKILEKASANARNRLSPSDDKQKKHDMEAVARKEAYKENREEFMPYDKILSKLLKANKSRKDK